MPMEASVFRNISSYVQNYTAKAFGSQFNKLGDVNRSQPAANDLYFIEPSIFAELLFETVFGIIDIIE
jgi:hypothetical protein